MEDNIIIKSECPISLIFMIRIIPIIIGIILMATCLVWETIFGDLAIFVSAGVGGIITLFGLAFLFTSWKEGIYVTKKKVYGTTLWGKRVDIPLDSISAVSLTGLFSGVAVASSSGKISFVFLKNKDEIFNEISKLIQERQDDKKTPLLKQENSSADEIKKYKDLLDSNVITQEEFDAKKKQILGL